MCADLRGQGEARRNRKPDRGHLCKVGTLAAQEVLHLGSAVRIPRAEVVDIGHDEEEQERAQGGVELKAKCLSRAITSLHNLAFCIRFTLSAEPRANNRTQQTWQILSNTGPCSLRTRIAS